MGSRTAPWLHGQDDFNHTSYYEVSECTPDTEVYHGASYRCTTLGCVRFNVCLSKLLADGRLKAMGRCFDAVGQRLHKRVDQCPAARELRRRHDYLDARTGLCVNR
jgi:hypothetical protein